MFVYGRTVSLIAHTHFTCQSDGLFLFKWAVLGQNKLQWRPDFLICQRYQWWRSCWHSGIVLFAVYHRDKEGERRWEYNELLREGYRYWALLPPPDSDPIPAAVKRASRPVKPSNTLAIPSSSVLWNHPGREGEPERGEGSCSSVPLITQKEKESRKSPDRPAVCQPI